ncbi:class I SAM-dependent methyltransferase [uncultured Erythrobacter sp.]|uniref:class I SAM-dependent methyltransferase n=1 Tax=uncultured Erythrobacter sp. TaxID=263913 RepID=UPI0026368B17|nr:class I SAM-dependent methyltransferase [uncultured Erythrobacter sp.]
MSENRRDHWQTVYQTKQVDRVSWFQPSTAPSLDALLRLGAGSDNSLIDIGAGASPLVADLARAGWDDLAMLDISEAALELARDAMGEAADKVEWIAADITRWSPRRRYDVWHDRAVFHFLTEASQRDAYRGALDKGLAPGGLLLIATFAPDGPEQCSDLPVQRYDAAGLSQALGDNLRLVEHWREVHVTPWQTEQAFTWAAFRKEPT